MKNYFKKIAAFLCKSWVWTLILVVLAAIFIWFVGPLFSFADYSIWESTDARLLTICGLFLLWGLLVVFLSWRSSVRIKKVEDSEEGQERLRREEETESQQKEISRRFKDALYTLKSTSLYRKRSERWRSELPWYVLIGPQGSGKTSLLDFSGLDFPLNKIERKLTRDTKGTLNYDWFFAEHGVLIDTAGRFLTQPDKPTDSSAWDTLLMLLRKHRRSRPLNGVLVNIPIDLLAKGGEQALERLGIQVRARLQEIHQRLHIDVPVYLVLSKADQLLGFNEFFDQLSREESEQVLGATFRKDQNGTDVTILRQELEKLLQRLNSQVILRMHQERDTARRGRVLDFPHQLAEISERLCLFVDMAFTGNRYQRKTLLRGFYLTSAPYLTETLDSNVAGIGSNLGIASSVLPTLHQGRSRFIHNLLSQVIFPEAVLAGLDKNEKRRINWGQRAIYLGAAAALSVFGIAWATSFSANFERLDEVKSIAQTLEKQDQILSPADGVRAALKPLNSSYNATQVFPPDADVALHERTGLYQGDASNPVLETAYDNELQRVLLPRIARLFETQIHTHMNDRQQLLENLRGYLMLSDTKRRDPELLKQQITSRWSALYRGDAQTQQQLSAHLDRLLELPFTYATDKPLIAQARQVLLSESFASVVYSILRDEAGSLPEYRLGQHMGSQSGVFSGTDYLIPGFYTQQGYKQYFISRGVSMVSEILRDNWVLGKNTDISGMDLRQLMVELEQLYFSDYADYWSEAVGRVELHEITNAQQGANQLASLTSANSPLLLLLTEVRTNTRFPTLLESAEDLPEVPDSGVAGAVADAAEAAKSKVDISKSLPDAAKKLLQRRFDPLHQLLTDEGSPTADLTPALQAVNDLQLQMANRARAGQSGQASFEYAKSRISGEQDALGNLLTASVRLPQPVGGWFAGIANQTWGLALADAYSYLNQRYQSELYSFYSKAIARRYPFSAGSHSDVSINDFNMFFKDQGIAQQFFDNYMRPFVTGSSGHYRLRSIAGHSLPMTGAFLKQMSNVRTIRQSFFAENPDQAVVKFELEPYNLDPSVSRAEFTFGEQRMEYRHGPIVTQSFVWPTDANNGQTSLVLERLVGRAVGVKKDTGPWSLFRFLDMMQTEPLRGRDVLLVKARVDDVHASYLLSSQRTPNPFDLRVLRRFQLPSHL